jgi:DNA-binding MarR family transcriptional regulator
MTDVTAPTLHRRGIAEGPKTLALSAAQPDPRLVTFVELLFFAYRDFTGEADAVLAELGFGRAHHRVLHFVNRNPGLRVADLLGILKITKQSLARVLKQLVDQGYIVQSAGEHDRRERRLALTEDGAALAHRLVALQASRIAAALRAAGGDADAATRQFLFAMIGEGERNEVAALIRDPELAT